MWEDLPIRDPSTFAFRGLSGIPQRTEWVYGSGNNISTQITISWYDCAWWWTYFLAIGPLAVHDGGTWVQGPVSQWWFNLYFPHMPSPKAQSQVSMTMVISELLSWAALDTSGQVLWSSTPKRPASMALGALPSHGLEDSTQTSGHFLSAVPVGKHSRWCGAGQSDLWGDLYSPFPSRQKYGTWHWCPPQGCDSTPRGGQQGIRMPIGD